jgi:hypothetical protein
MAALEFLLQTLLDELQKRETASVFSTIAADWIGSQQIIANLGFKVSARLTDHIVRDDGFVGGQLWHRRLATTAQPKLPSFI